MNTQTDKVEGTHQHIKEMEHNNRKKNRTPIEALMSCGYSLTYEALIVNLPRNSFKFHIFPFFYMEPRKNKEWFFFSKREILWRMERVQRTRSGSLFTQTETIKMWRWQPQVNQNDLWSTFWAIWKSFGKILAMTNQWRWLWISEVKFKKRLQLTVGLKWTLKILGIVKTPLLEYFLGEGGSKIDFKRRVLQLPKSVSARIYCDKACGSN